MRYRELSAGKTTMSNPGLSRFLEEEEEDEDDEEDVEDFVGEVWRR
jgi:hypothetical protein